MVDICFKKRFYTYFNNDRTFILMIVFTFVFNNDFSHSFLVIILYSFLMIRLIRNNRNFGGVTLGKPLIVLTL